MISLPWLFVGILVGLLIVSVFDPPKRQIPSLPTPSDTGIFKTKSGCVRVASTNVPCTEKATSLNLIAEQHK